MTAFLTNYAKAVVTLIEHQDLRRATASLQTLIQAISTSEACPSGELAIIYATGLFHLMMKQPIQDMRVTLAELKCIAEQADNEEIIAMYAMGVSLLITRDNEGRSDNITELQRVTNTRRLGVLRERFRNIPLVQQAYASALAYTSANQSVPERKLSLHQLRDMVQGNPDESLADVYSLALCNDIAAKEQARKPAYNLRALGQLAQQHPGSRTISNNYASGLSLHANRQPTAHTLRDCLEQMQALYQRRPDEVLAVRCAEILTLAASVNNSNTKYVDQLKVLRDQYLDNESINTMYIAATQAIQKAGRTPLSAGGLPKPLSAKEERACLERIRDGDEEAKNKLIEHNLRLVAHIIKRYYSGVQDQEDLISIGTIGLIKAANTFDYEKGTRFATYASRCIENEILMHFRKQGKFPQNVYSSNPINTDKEGLSLSLFDIISEDPDVPDQVDLRLKTEQLYKLIESHLTEREQKILTMRYGLSDQKPLTQREVAIELGVSSSYVSRIEKAAVGKLRKQMQRSFF